jgi:hypothetical protein
VLDVDAPWSGSHALVSSLALAHATSPNSATESLVPTITTTMDRRLAVVRARVLRHVVDA